MKFDPSHLPVAMLITDKAHAFLESLPALYKAMGVLISVVSVYVGLTIQNTRLEERQVAMNSTLSQIRVNILKAETDRRDIANELVESKEKLADSISEIHRTDDACKLRQEWLADRVKALEAKLPRTTNDR